MDNSRGGRIMEMEETLERLGEEDLEIRDALRKIEEAVKGDFKKRPWHYMSLLEIDPEIVKALEEPKREVNKKWVYVYVALFVGFALYVIPQKEFGVFYWQCWFIIAMAMVGVSAGLFTAKV